MARDAIQQKDGSILDPGTWVHLTAKDGAEFVGRFSGVYQNPRFGWMFYLSFARPTDGSKPSTTIFWRMTDDNGAFASLENAIPDREAKDEGREAHHHAISPVAIDGSLISQGQRL